MQHLYSVVEQCTMHLIALCISNTHLQRGLVFQNCMSNAGSDALQNAGWQASEEHAESRSTQSLLPGSPLDAEQVLKMPLFDGPIDMGISPSDPSEDDFWVDPDMWNSDSDDPTDSVCSILLEDAQSCSVSVDVPQCNLNLGNMDDLFNFVGGSPTFDGLWMPGQ